MPSVIYSPTARLDLKNLPHGAAKRIFRAIKGIKSDPYSSVKNIKGPAGSTLYSLRDGDYRVVMTIEGYRMIIFVIDVGPRSTISPHSYENGLIMDVMPIDFSSFEHESPDHLTSNHSQYCDTYWPQSDSIDHLA
jgi:mRNA interferase RelE/StbE